jgi:hypothetical protein
MGCISSSPSLIKTSRILGDMSGLDMAHKYRLDRKDFWISNKSVDFKAIRCGCMLSIVAITVSIANLSNLIYALLNLSRRARSRERPVRFLLVDI